MARIGMLTTSYPREPGDAAGAFVRGLARALADRGHTIEVLAPEPADAIAAPIEPGIDVHWVPYVRPRALARTFYGAGVPDNVRDPRAWPGLATFPAALLAHAREAVGGWDAIVSHWALPSALIAGWVRGSRPHLAIVHSADAHVLSRLPGRAAFARTIADGASDLLFTSRGMRDAFLQWVGPARGATLAGACHVSAMGFDPAPLPPRKQARQAIGVEPRRAIGRASANERRSGFGPREARLDARPTASDRRATGRPLALLSMSRLVPIKGIDDAIEAADAVGAELWIAGDGPSRAALERAARGKVVRFFGHVHGPRKALLFAAADAFVAPSRRQKSGRTEGMPTTLLEAAHAGLAIVTSDVGGIGDVFTHERNALLVPGGDRDALRAAIERLRDPDLRRRLGRAAKTVARRYTWSAIAPHVERLLQIA